MIDPPEPPHPLVVHWLKRHRSAISFILHLIGIPPTILGVLLFAVYVQQVSFPVFVLSIGLFVGGYALQFAGHYLEGTDPGEVIYFKRVLGIPYVEFPRGCGPFHEPAPPMAPSAADVAGESFKTQGMAAGDTSR